MKKNSQILFLILDKEEIAEIKFFNNGKILKLTLTTKNPVKAICNLYMEYPEAYLIWYDKNLQPFLSDVLTWPDLMKHDLEVLHLSCFQRCDLMAESLGFIDFSAPFLIPGPIDRRYVTWLISPMAGIALAKTFHAFGFGASLKNFNTALFDLGRRGSRAGLCPYSEPELLAKEIPPEVLMPLKKSLPKEELAILVTRIYGKKWLLFWAMCWVVFRYYLPLKALLKALVAKKPADIDSKRAKLLHPSLADVSLGEVFLEVIIPTLDRSQQVMDVLGDLSLQTLLPKRVIIIEQSPTEKRSGLENGLRSIKWPFDISYHCLENVGVCRARNFALKQLRGDWALMLDDDVRLRQDLIKYLLQVGKAYYVDAVNARVLLEHQQSSHETKSQLPCIWQTFGSGAALLSRKAVETTGNFDQSLEGGFGEDYEFGVRMRMAGNNIFYAPAEPVLHLKSTRGGFRSKIPHPWDNEKTLPRPSPILLWSMNKHNSQYMQDGYKLFYWLKRLVSVPFYNWPREIALISKQWHSAMKWSESLSEILEK